MPCDFIEQFSLADRHALLAHELAHVACRDALWNLIGHSVCHLFFFQPLNFVARRQLRVDADERAALILGDRTTIAGCLTRIGKQFAGRRSGNMSQPIPGSRDGVIFPQHRYRSQNRIRTQCRPPRYADS
ncbi:MAG: hypothetical protein GY758_12620 [Fuerstiella sp.]|nr:hypothetical protein [Fuerstiella sp.]MCP4506588.1 hypothetical protein [Fuerstiella sp.]